MTKPNTSFNYEVRIPYTAKPVDQFHIQDTHWNNPVGRRS